MHDPDDWYRDLQLLLDVILHGGAPLGCGSSDAVPTGATLVLALVAAHLLAVQARVVTDAAGKHFVQAWTALAGFSRTVIVQ